MNKKILSFLIVITILIFSSCGSEPQTNESEGNGVNSSNSEAFSSDSSPNANIENSDELQSAKEAFFSLLELDMQIIKLASNNTDIPLDEHNEGEYLKCSDEYSFSNYTALKEAAENVYFESSIILQEFLEYPKYGAKNIKIIDNEVYIHKNSYNTDMNALIKDSVKIKEIQPSSDIVCEAAYEISFKTDFDQKYLNVELIKTIDNKFKLKNSVFFIIEQHIENTSKELLWEENEYLDSAQNEGSSKKLQGDCLIINIFLTDDETDWDSRSISGVYDYLNEALEYIGNSAEKFGVDDLNLINTDKNEALFFKFDGVIPKDLNYFAWIDEMLAYTSYESLSGYVEEYFNLSEYDNVSVLLHVNKPGRSYAIPCDSDNYDYKLFWMERSVLYYNTDTDNEYFICPATYAHELLHLYGAIDLYEINGLDPKIAELAEKYFNDEIMRYIPVEEVENAVISEFTAFRIGWISYLDEQLKQLLPNYASE